MALVTCLVAGPARAAPSSDPAHWVGDVRFLRAAIDSLHPAPYRAHSKAQWDSATAALEHRLPALRYHEAVAAFSSFVGLLGDGHSRLAQLRLAAHTRPTLEPLPGPEFAAHYPIGFAVTADGLWIVRARAPDAALVGSRVIAIGGRPTGEAIAALARLIPADNAMWVLHLAPEYLRSPAYVSAAGLVADPAAPLRLILLASHAGTRSVSVRPTVEDSTVIWAEATTAPPALRVADAAMVFADVRDSAHTVYARLRAIVDEPGRETVAAFAAGLFAHVDSVGARRLILDLRGNGGGDNYLNQPLVHGVLRRPAIDRTGGLFVMIDRGTFSAAVSLAADLQRETHALFAGEPTGGAPNSPGDPASVTLPVSRVVVRIATVLWNGSDPRDPRPCIFPDLPAIPTWADARAGRDVVLDAIAAYRAPLETTEIPPNQHWAAPRQLHGELPTIRW